MKIQLLRLSVIAEVRIVNAIDRVHVDLTDTVTGGVPTFDTAAIVLQPTRSK